MINNFVIILCIILMVFKLCLGLELWFEWLIIWMVVFICFLWVKIGVILVGLLII